MPEGFDFRDPLTGYVEDLLFPGPATGIPSTEKIGAGTNVVACWPTATPLPQRSTLEEAAATLGEPFTLSYLTEEHQGVTLSGDRYGWEVQKAFADVTGGDAPLLFALSADAEYAVGAEKAGETLKESVKESLDNVRKAAQLGADMPSYLLIGGLILGGMLVVGAGIWFVMKRKR